MCVVQTVYILHCGEYIAICINDAIADSFDRFDLFFISRLTICQVINFFLPLSQKFIPLFAVSSLFELIFIIFSV